MGVPQLWQRIVRQVIASGGCGDAHLLPGRDPARNGSGLPTNPRAWARSGPARRRQRSSPRPRRTGLGALWTLALDSGSVQVVATRLGHSDPSITLPTHAHPLPTSQPDASDLIGAALCGG